MSIASTFIIPKNEQERIVKLTQYLNQLASAINLNRNGSLRREDFSLKTGAITGKRITFTDGSRSSEVFSTAVVNLGKVAEQLCKKRYHANTRLRKQNSDSHIWVCLYGRSFKSGGYQCQAAISN